MRSIEEVLADLAGGWMDLEGVEGLAVGEHEGRPCILVLTSVDPAAVGAHLPRNVDGHPVVIEGTGEIRARPD